MDNDIDNGEVNVNDQLVSNFSFGEAEALNDEIEEVSQIVDESDSVLLESLRKLRLMALTVDTLKETEIGKVADSTSCKGFNREYIMFNFVYEEILSFLLAVLLFLPNQELTTYVSISVIPLSSCSIMASGAAILFNKCVASSSGYSLPRFISGDNGSRGFPEKSQEQPASVLLISKTEFMLSKM
ncbi:hypothetical protein DKX38_002921 [Salix brachista]|uniref:Uncharacterized protein n=1 Tax=Salix brachista TaxID=2182728 RepID=A0A5N5NQ90_9ROSI|nr:hypothetical protein DKX38_002921 [Salix brachista]